MDNGYYVLLIVLVLSGPLAMWASEHNKSPQEQRLEAFKKCMEEKDITEATCKELTK